MNVLPVNTRINCFFFPKKKATGLPASFLAIAVGI